MIDAGHAAVWLLIAAGFSYFAGLVLIATPSGHHRALRFFDWLTEILIALAIGAALIWALR